MSNGFDEREKAFEDKWAHDENLRFRVEARRDKLLGLWAAGEMGLSGRRGRGLCQDRGRSRHGRGRRRGRVRASCRADFDAKGIARSDHLIRTKMDEFLAVAKEQVMHEVK